MRGRILDYSVQANEGIITGEDGFRYTFAGSQWRESTTPVRGRAVDFEVAGANAVDVYHALDNAATSATPTDLPRSGIPTMQVQVLAYSVQDNSGIISGGNGVRYTFAGPE